MADFTKILFLLFLISSCGAAKKSIAVDPISQDEEELLLSKENDYTQSSEESPIFQFLLAEYESASENTQKALTYYEQVLEKDDSGFVNKRYLKAKLKHLKANEIALDEYKSYTLKFPKDYDFKTIYASALLKTPGQNLQGKNILKQAIILEPKRFEAYDLLISDLLDQKKIDEARLFIEGYLQKFPFEAKYWFELSKIYLSSRENKKALEALKKAHEIDPQGYNLYLGLVYLKNQHTKEARKILEPIFAKEIFEPSFVQEFLNHVKEIMISSKIALNLWKKLSIPKEHLYLDYGRSLLLLDTNEPEKALEELKKAKIYLKDQPFILLLLAQSYLAQKDLKNALTTLREVKPYTKYYMFSVITQLEALFLLKEYDLLLKLVQEASNYPYSSPLFFDKATEYLQKIASENPNTPYFLDSLKRLYYIKDGSSSAPNK